MIGIIGAMETEVKSLVSSIANLESQTISNLTFYKGNLCGKEVVVVKSGVGKVNAAICTQTLIANFKPDCVINTGVAGALESGLKMFDFVVSTAAVHHDVDVQIFGYKPGQVPGFENVMFKADEKLIGIAEKAFNATPSLSQRKLVKGIVASGDQFISSNEKKNFIKSTFNASCAEMEGASIAHTCFVNKTPFIIVRCMSDMADEAAEAIYTYSEDVAASECADFLMKTLEII